MQLTPVMSSAYFLDPSEVKNLIHSERYFSGSSNSWASAFDCTIHYELVLCALGGLVGHLSRLKVCTWKVTLIFWSLDFLGGNSNLITELLLIFK